MTHDSPRESATSQHGWRHYLNESRRPLVSLVFVLPLILVYEGGVWVLGPDAIRNGADVLLRQMLGVLGFGQYLLLPLLLCGLLLGWHHTTHQPWRLSPSVLPIMWVEALVWGVGLLIVFQLLQGVVAMHMQVAVADTAESPGNMARVVAFCGAGLYEEMLFRLILLSGMIGLVRAVGGTPKATTIAAVIVTSLVFSAAHYQPFTPAGEQFQWFTFIFRFLAGVYFSVLFLRRGFGIAAGAHALYDILTLLLHILGTPQ